MQIALREAERVETDRQTVWSILRPAVEAGDVFCAPPDGGRDGALAYFWPNLARVWIAELHGAPAGCFYIRPNQTGNGDHICNAGYCTHGDAAGRGVARFMLDASLRLARGMGFAAMQFSFVVASNTRAIDTWHRAGFETIGRIPRAFRHPTSGLTDALVLYRDL